MGRTLVKKGARTTTTKDEAKGVTVKTVTTETFSDGSTREATRTQVRGADDKLVELLFKGGDGDAEIKLETEERLRALFQEYDKDGSGFLEVGELLALMGEMRGREIDPAVGDRILDAIDADDDDKVSFDEFAAAYPGLQRVVAAIGAAQQDRRTPQCNRPRRGLREASAKDAPPALTPVDWCKTPSDFKKHTHNGKPPRGMLVMFGRPSNGKSKACAALLKAVAKKENIPTAMLTWTVGNKSHWPYGMGTHTEPYVSVLRHDGTHVCASTHFSGGTAERALLMFYKKHRGKDAPGAAADAVVAPLDKTPPPTPPEKKLEAEAEAKVEYLTADAFAEKLREKLAEPTVLYAGRPQCGNCRVTLPALRESKLPSLVVGCDDPDFCMKCVAAFGGGGTLPLVRVRFPDGTGACLNGQTLRDADAWRAAYEKAVADHAARGPAEVYLAPEEFGRQLNGGRPAQATIVVAGREVCGNCRHTLAHFVEAHGQGVPVLRTAVDGDNFWSHFRYSAGGMLPFVALVRSDGSHKVWDGLVTSAAALVAWYHEHKGVDEAVAMPPSPMHLKGDGDKDTGGTAVAPARPADMKVPEPGASFMTDVEKDIWLEIEYARTHPKEYAQVIKADMQEIKKSPFGDRWGILKGDTWTLLNEGPEAWQEAIDDLLQQASLPPTKAAPVGLVKSCRDHCKDHGPKGLTGHGGTDKSTPSIRMSRHGSWRSTCGENIHYGSGVSGRECVVSLIVDAGVPSRGHRKNIYNAAFAALGVGVGPHTAFDNVCVCNMAGAYTDKTDTAKK